MKKEFLINLVFLVVINLLIKPFYVFGIDVGVQNTVGATSYGIYFTLYGYCLILQIFADFGIQNYNSTYLSKNPTLAKNYIPRLMATKVLLSIFFLGSLFLVAVIMQYPTHYYWLIAYIGINQILLSFILYLRTNLSATGFYRWDSVVSIIDKLIVIIVLGYLLWYSPINIQENFRIEWFIWAQTLAFSITLLFLLLIINKKIGLRFPAFSWTFSKEILHKSMPYALIVILMTAYTRVDTIMLERLLDDGATEAGIYAASYRLLDASNMIGYLFAVLLLPMFARMIGKKESVEELVVISFKIMFLGALVLISFLVLNASDIMQWLYEEGSNPYYASILQVVILSFLAIGLSYIFGTLLTANGSTKAMNIVFGIGLFANLILNFWLIPQYKAYGAGLSTFVTQFFVMIAQVILVFRIFKINIQYALLVRLLLILVIVPAVFWSLTQVSTIWWLNFPLGILICLLVSLLIRFIDYKEIMRSLRSMNSEQ